MGLELWSRESSLTYISQASLLLRSEGLHDCFEFKCLRKKPCSESIKGYMAFCGRKNDF